MTDKDAYKIWRMIDNCKDNGSVDADCPMCKPCHEMQAELIERTRAELIERTRQENMSNHR